MKSIQARYCLSLASLLVTLVSGCSSSATTTTANSDSSQAQERKLRSAKEIAATNKPAVVRVESPLGVGTGFIVDKQGIIVTNLHVIAGAKEIKVSLLDGRSFQVKAVLGYDPRRDLALLKIEAPDLSSVTLGDSARVSAGDPVVAIGNPLGVFEFSVSDGLISSVRKIEDSFSVLQVSAPISQGSSGGPLFNDYGEVVGVAFLIVNRGQNLNFAIPINYVRPLLDSQKAMPVDAFRAEILRKQAEARTAAATAARSKQGRQNRNIPNHPETLLDKCSEEQVSLVFLSIQKAISLGAPVYNAGDFEGCFVIYRNLARRLEDAEGMCKGVRDALGTGLLRAETLNNYTDKAWALRDTFDGLKNVIMRKFGTP